MRHVFNVVSGGILLGLSLLAITILTALYATAWQAATIFAVIAGVISSVSLYFGARTETQAVEKKLAQALVRERSLSESLALHQEYSGSLETSLAQAHERQRDLERDAALDSLLLEASLSNAQVIVHIVIEAQPEEEHPLFI
jgi:hypothetical protein